MNDVDIEKNEFKEILIKLQTSKFRKSFHLRKKELQYTNEKGINEIENHAKQFIIERIASKDPKNDGKQTPMKNHPVFIAQHATATCCRSCLEKWHKISKGIILNEKQIKYITELIMIWIKIQIKYNIMNERSLNSNMKK